MRIIAEQILLEPGPDNLPDDYEPTDEDLLQLCVIEYYAELLEQGVPATFAEFLSPPVVAWLRDQLMENHAHQLDSAVQKSAGNSPDSDY